MKIEAIQRSPLSAGKRYLLAHMEGKPLTVGQALKAKCCECMNGYIDGRVDCHITDCPIYPRMPFRGVDRAKT